MGDVFQRTWLGKVLGLGGDDSRWKTTDSLARRLRWYVVHRVFLYDWKRDPLLNPEDSHMR